MNDSPSRSLPPAGDRAPHLLRDGRILAVWRDGFREERKRRGFRPDRHEVWRASGRILSPLEAVQQVGFIEVILQTVKEELVTRLVLSEEASRESEVRTTGLLKLLGLVH